MNDKELEIIDKLIEEKKIDEANNKLSKLGQEYHSNPEYLFIRSKIFYLNKLYYLALDTLLVAFEFQKNDKIYNLIAKIYESLENKELSKKIRDPQLRLEAIKSLKEKLSGIYIKKD